MISKFKAAVFFLLVAALAGVAGCSPKLTQFTSADNGGQVSLKAGQQFDVVLEGNASTGFVWQAQDLDTALLQQVGEPKFTSDNPDLVGSSGKQTLTFKALKAGTTTLTLVYLRPWETVPPVNTFSVTLTIK
jgi:inhibitor of cysteine peptidase